MFHDKQLQLGFELEAVPACENQKRLSREAGGKLWELGAFWVSGKDDKIVYHKEWPHSSKGKVVFMAILSYHVYLHFQFYPIVVQTLVWGHRTGKV